MVQRVYAITRRNEYSEKNWNDVDTEGKKEILNRYLSEVADVMGLDICKEIEFFYEDSNVSGRYVHEEGKIKINEKLLNTYRRLSTVRHELRHAYQYNVTEGMLTATWRNRTGIPTETLLSWLKNINDYIPPTEEGYSQQPIERDAYEWTMITLTGDY